MLDYPVHRPERRGPFQKRVSLDDLSRAGWVYVDAYYIRGGVANNRRTASGQWLTAVSLAEAAGHLRFTRKLTDGVIWVPYAEVSFPLGGVEGDTLGHYVRSTGDEVEVLGTRQLVAQGLAADGTGPAMVDIISHFRAYTTVASLDELNEEPGILDYWRDVVAPKRESEMTAAMGRSYRYPRGARRPVRICPSPEQVEAVMEPMLDGSREQVKIAAAASGITDCDFPVGYCFWEYPLVARPSDMATQYVSVRSPLVRDGVLASKVEVETTVFGFGGDYLASFLTTVIPKERRARAS